LYNTFLGGLCHLEACAQEQVNGCVDQLPVGVQVFTKKGNFGAIFNPVEQNFVGIGCQVLAAEDVIFFLEGR
jgi:hypothetical protein